MDNQNQNGYDHDSGIKVVCCDNILMEGTVAATECCQRICHVHCARAKNCCEVGGRYITVMLLKKSPAQAAAGHRRVENEPPLEQVVRVIRAAAENIVDVSDAVIQLVDNQIIRNGITPLLEAMVHLIVADMWLRG